MAGLSVFGGIKAHPLLAALRVLLRDLAWHEPGNPAGDGGISSSGALDLIRSWASFTETFVRHNRAYSFPKTVAFLAKTDDNPFTRAAERQEAGDIPPVLRVLAAGDLSRLGRLAALDLTRLGLYIAGILRNTGFAEEAEHITEGALALGPSPEEPPGGDGDLFPPGRDWGAALPALAGYIRVHGAGKLGLHGSFYWSSGKIPFRPVRSPDPIRLAGLSGYEEQRSVVVANTLRFLEGKPANNVLLYGDRGTGKSAAVKAVCNEYAPRGLRLLELRKGDLPRLSRILDTLSTRGLRFIVFIDDLSFETAGDSFTTLKALLEGGIEARPPNVVVYATSNRRHLVKESLADRPTTAMAAEAASSGDVRAFDTMQEQFSLADRFGITVVFSAPSQEEYLGIAEFIARRRGLLPPSGEGGPGGLPDDSGQARRLFRENALRWERWFNGRSPRTAVQYVDWVAGGAGFPWE
jgi:predicted AAA+ superfamily ATPase